MKKNRLGSAEVGSCICYGLMALLQVGWLAVLLTAQLVPPVWVTRTVRRRSSPTAYASRAPSTW